MLCQEDTDLLSSAVRKREGMKQLFPFGVAAKQKT